MRIGIHPDHMWGCSFSDKWSQLLKERGVEILELNLLSKNALEQAKECDGVMWRWFHIQDHKQSARVILHTIENHLDIPVFPSSRTSWHFDDKIAQYYLLQAIGAPQPEAWIFWNREEALKWVETAPYPVIFKLTSGAGSSNVLKVDHPIEARKLIQRMFCRGIFPMTMNEYRPPLLPRTRRELRERFSRVVDAAGYAATGEYPRLREFWWKPEMGYAYFQEFLPDNTCDTRVTVIGNRAFAFRRMNRPGDFRASGSGNIDWNPAKIDPACLRIAFDVSAKAGFQTMAYDFLYREGKPVICEISYTFVDSAVFNCPGQWDPELNWHEGHRWPEEAQIEDFMVEVLKRSKR
ncbi:RimK family alpha-L-glutamate ligase [Geobacter sp. SVR]|uniref:ATP-grasp domain-containing protein n=1 Tax=Geobacter sp. SVR TaxID=2495594 RepID=UPI00143EFC26|nr:hypothetical protein [Geobacter sp. SVR]BCS54870.1 hypothetical protein GSVR_31780 [Geobacter sp. SVR]GCF87388.1 hypothetical protein GSbR_39880 [Geobacter sp. SVR]